jgi:hypothetical protein
MRRSEYVYQTPRPGAASEADWRDCDPEADAWATFHYNARVNAPLLLIGPGAGWSGPWPPALALQEREREYGAELAACLQERAGGPPVPRNRSLTDLTHGPRR